MSNVIARGKSAVTWFAVVATILWSVGFSAIAGSLTANAASLTDGDLIKRADLTTVYYYQDGGRYTFPNQTAFESWYENFDGVVTVTAEELSAIPLVDNAVMRPGTYLVKITTDPKVYAVEPGGVLRWVTSEDVAKALWGDNWGSMVRDVADAFFTNYTIGDDLESGDFPTGYVGEMDGNYYYVEDGEKRMVSDAAFAGNRFMTKFVASGDLSGLSSGDDLGEFEVSDTAQTGAEVNPGTPVSGGSLSISLNSSETPASDSVIVDTTGTSIGQRFAGMLAANFKANGGDAVVTEVTAERLGVSKDEDVDEWYLMDGDMVLAKTSSISEGTITWKNSGGLFTVSSGQTKTVWVKADINNAASVGKTIGVKITGAELSGNGSVSGTAMGNNMTVASVTDLGYLEITTTSPVSATTMDADADLTRELAKFTLDANDQDLLVKNITFTQIGSVDTDDLRDIKLKVAGEQFGATYENLGDDTLMFDMSGHADGGLKITSGQSKVLELHGVVAGGTNRTFKFSVQDEEDVLVWEMEYGVFAPVLANNATTYQVQTTADTTINTGSLTLQISDESPSLSVPDGATNVLFAAFDLTAAGEDMEVDSLAVTFNGSGADEVMKNVKVRLDGNQVGTTVSTLTADNSSQGSFTFSNNFVVKAGETSVVSVYADTTGNNIATGDTLSASLVAGSSNAQGKSSLEFISTASISGRTLNVESGVPTLAENLSIADGSSTNPTAVLNAENVKLSSFVVKAGAGEGSKITNMTMKADVTGGLSGAFVNLRLQHNGADIAPVKGTLTSGASDTYDFTLTEALELDQSEEYVVDVVADVKSSTSTAISTDTDGIIYPSSVTYQTANTSQSGTVSMSAGLQNVFIAVNGTLTAAASSDAPSGHHVAMGASDVEVGAWKLSASRPEDLTIDKFTVSFVAESTKAITSAIGNVRLMEGDTMVGSAVASLASSDATGVTDSTAYATFSNLNYNVPRNSSKTLRAVVDFTTQPDSLSSSTFSVVLLSGFDTSDNDAIEARGKNSGTTLTTTTGISGLSYDGLDGQTTNTFFSPLKAVLSIAHASDAPSGASSAGDDQTVAKWVLSNAANANTQSITLKLLNLQINTSISQSVGSDRTLKVYKKSISAANQLVSTEYVDDYTNAPLSMSGDDSDIEESAFTDATIESGQDMTIIVTLDTSDATSNDSLTVGLVTSPSGSNQGSGVQWSDGQTDVYEINPTSSGVGGLPFLGKTLTY